MDKFIRLFFIFSKSLSVLESWLADILTSGEVNG